MTEPRRHLLHVFSTFDAGGPEVRTADLIAALPPRFEHSILAMDNRYGCADRVPGERIREWLGEPPRKGIGIVLRLARRIDAVQPDLVLTYNWGAIETVLASRLRGKPVIHHEEGFGSDERERQKRRRVWARRVLLRTANSVIVPSRRLQRIATEVWKLPAELVRLVPNGIDVERFSPGDRAAARAALGLPAEGRVVGSIGHLTPVKAHVRLVEALVGLDPSWRLLVIGEGGQRAAIEARARELGVADRLTLPGSVRDTSGVYRAMDLYAISSTTEQMPISLLEAMATGLAVVSTDVGDVATMVAEPNRRFVVPASEFGAALVELASDEGLRADLGQANRLHCAATYPRQRMIETYLQLYEAALAPRRRTPPCSGLSSPRPSA